MFSRERIKNSILFQKLFLHTVRKSCSSDGLNILKIRVGRPRICKKNLRSLEQSNRIVKGKINF